MKRILFLLLLCCLGIARAEDVTLKTGVILKNATVSKRDPSSVTFSHDDGILKVWLAELPEELQKKFGYDPAKSAEYSQKEAEAYEKTTRAAKLDKILDDFGKLAPEVHVQVIQALAGGAICRVTSIKEPAPGKVTQLGKGVIEVEKQAPKLGFIKEGETIFISGLKNVIDNDSWEGKIWPGAFMTYETVGAGTKKVRKYTTSPSTAIGDMLKSKD